MSEFHPNRVRPLRPRFTVRRLINYWPLLIWLAVLIIAYWSYNKGASAQRLNGLVDPIQESVAPDEDGRLLEILVKRGQSVRAGDVVARMDTTGLDKQIEKLEAAIASDLEDRLLRAQFDLSRLKTARRDLLRDQAADTGELRNLEALQAAFDQLEKTMGNTIAAKVAFSEAKARIAGDVGRLRGTTGLYQNQIDEMDKEIEELEKGVQRLKEGMKNPEELARANGDLAELQALRVLRDRFTLVATHDGVVDRIEKEVGEFVQKGEAILRIVANPEVVRALLPQHHLGAAQLGQKVWISSTSNKYEYFESEVISLSPRINNVPDTSNPLPNSVVHGQEVILKYPEDSNFQPGQTVIVHLKEPGKMPLITKLFGQGTPAP